MRIGRMILLQRSRSCYLFQLRFVDCGEKADSLKKPVHDVTGELVEQLLSAEEGDARGQLPNGLNDDGEKEEIKNNIFILNDSFFAPC